MKVNIGHQPLTEDYKTSRRVIDNSFDNACDAINNLQAQINKITKDTEPKKLANTLNYYISTGEVGYFYPENYGDHTRSGVNIALACAAAAASALGTGKVKLSGGTYAVTASADFLNIPLDIGPACHMIISDSVVISNLRIHGTPDWTLFTGLGCNEILWSKHQTFARAVWYGIAAYPYTEMAAMTDEEKSVIATANMLAITSLLGYFNVPLDTYTSCWARMRVDWPSGYILINDEISITGVNYRWHGESGVWQTGITAGTVFHQIGINKHVLKISQYNPAAQFHNIAFDQGLKATYASHKAAVYLYNSAYIDFYNCNFTQSNYAGCECRAYLVNFNSCHFSYNPGNGLLTPGEGYSNAITCNHCRFLGNATVDAQELDGEVLVTRWTAGLNLRISAGFTMTGGDFEMNGAVAATKTGACILGYGASTVFHGDIHTEGNSNFLIHFGEGGLNENTLISGFDINDDVATLPVAFVFGDCTVYNCTIANNNVDSYSETKLFTFLNETYHRPGLKIERNYYQNPNQLTPLTTFENTVADKMTIRDKDYMPTIDQNLFDSTPPSDWLIGIGAGDKGWINTSVKYINKPTMQMYRSGAGEIPIYRVIPITSMQNTALRGKYVTASLHACADYTAVSVYTVILLASSPTVPISISKQFYAAANMVMSSSTKVGLTIRIPDDATNLSLYIYAQGGTRNYFFGGINLSVGINEESPAIDTMILLRNSGAPYAGTWNICDEVIDKTLTASVPLKYICAEKGTFGSETLTGAITDGSTAVITNLNATALLYFSPGEYVKLSAGMPSATTAYQIQSIDRDAHTITLDTNSTSAQSGVTVSYRPPVFQALADTGNCTSTYLTKCISGKLATSLLRDDGTNVHQDTGKLSLGFTTPMDKISVAGTVYNYKTPNTAKRIFLTERDWSVRTNCNSNVMSGVIWCPDFGMFIAISKTLGTHAASYSYDAINWIEGTTEAQSYLVSICYSKQRKKAVAVAKTGTGHRVQTTIDGTTWLGMDAAEANGWTKVCYAPEIDTFCAVSEDGTNRCMISTNGAADWTAQSLAENNTMYGVCWSPKLKLFVAVSYDGTNRVQSSPSGLTGSWTAYALPVQRALLDVCWAAEPELFVAVAQDGTGSRIFTSPDSVVWTARNNSVNNNFTKVEWCSEIGLCIAIAGSGTGTRISWSPDCILWFNQTGQPDLAYEGLCWCPDLEIAVAVANDVTTGNIITSAKPVINSLLGAVEPFNALKGTKVYYVADSSEGAVDRKLTFTNGLLTAET